MVASFILGIVVPLAIGIGFLALGLEGIKNLRAEKKKKEMPPKTRRAVLKDEDGNFRTYDIIHEYTD